MKELNGALLKMVENQQRVIELVSELGLETVHTINFTDYGVTRVLVNFQELVALPNTVLETNETHVHASYEVAGVRFAACIEKGVEYYG